jgi:hypothetical protein
VSDRLEHGSRAARRGAVAVIADLVAEGIGVDELKVQWFAANEMPAIVCTTPSLGQKDEEIQRFVDAYAVVDCSSVLVVDLMKFGLITAGEWPIERVLTNFEGLKEAASGGPRIAVVIPAVQHPKHVVLFHPFEEYTIIAGPLEFLLAATGLQIIKAAEEFESLHRQLAMFASGVHAEDVRDEGVVTYQRPLIAQLNDWLVAQRWEERLANVRPFLPRRDSGK